MTWALDGGEWSASRSGRFIPSERAPCTHWIGGLVEGKGKEWEYEDCVGAQGLEKFVCGKCRF